MPRCYMVKKDPAPLEGIPPCSPTEASVAPPCYTPHDTLTGPRPAQYAETTHRVETQYKEPRSGDFAENSGGESTSPSGAASRHSNGIFTVLRAAQYTECLDEQLRFASPETTSEDPHREEYAGPRTVQYLEQDFSAIEPCVVDYAKQQAHCDDPCTTGYAEPNIDDDGTGVLHDVEPQVMEMETEEDEQTNYAELQNMSGIMPERSAADTEAAHELLSLAAGVPPLPPATVNAVLSTPEPALPNIYTYALQPANIYIIADEPSNSNLYATTLQSLTPLQQVELTAQPQVSTYIIQQPVAAPSEQYQPMFDGAGKSGGNVGESVSVINIAPVSENVKVEPKSVQVSVIEPVPKIQPLPTPKAATDAEETAPRCVKNKKNNYNCNECGKRYATSSNLSRHKQTHRSLDSQAAKLCGECGKAYVSMPALAMHVLTHRMGFVCGVCGKQFSRPWLLRGHLRSHTGEKPYNCSSCYKSFADRSNLRAHLQTHTGDKRWECTRCNKTFALKSYLNKHQEAACSQDEEVQ